MSLTKEEYREKECKTISEHLATYDNDYSNFDSIKLFEDVKERAFIDAFETIDADRFEKELDGNEDKRKLSDFEFWALIGYLTYCNGRQERAFVDRFIDDMIKLDIPDELELLIPLAKYYDKIYFESEEAVDRINDFVKKYKSYNPEKESKFDKLNRYVDKKLKKKESTYPFVEQEDVAFDYSVYLNLQKDKCEIYKKTQLKKFYDHFCKYSFEGITDFTRELKWMLPDINYDVDYMLSNFPDMELVKKDYEALHGKSIVPYSISLYKDYLFNKDRLDEESNNLGTYNIHRVGEVPVPFTKEEFLLGIHNDIDKNQAIELEGNKNISRIH